MITTDLAHRETLTALVGTYKKAVDDITTAYAMLDAAKLQLQAVFKSPYMEVIRRNNSGGTDSTEVAAILKDINRRAWSVIVDRMEIRKMLSIKRCEELNNQLAGESRSRYEETPELPELTEANILGMFKDTMAKAADYANEAVYEVFDWLRPCAGHTSELKTNDKWRIGKKVIIGYAVQPGYRGKYTTNYHREKNLIALDNVFHMLDGKGAMKTHYGPLCEAIKDSEDGTGETDFFKFKCHKNNNLHIEFKRLDLVQKINKTAGGNRLKEA